MKGKNSLEGSRCPGKRLEVKVYWVWGPAGGGCGAGWVWGRGLELALTAAGALRLVPIAPAQRGLARLPISRLFFQLLAKKRGKYSA